MKYSKISISNAAAPTGEIGGTYSHSYQYDELNRLISASGKAKDKNYELLMRYDVMSNPLQKDSVTYEYNTPNHPNAVSSAGGKLFTYDANGNPISVEDTTANTLRVMQWDEENRLQSLGDDGYVSRYTYNHAGERVIKSHGPTTVAFVNGAPQGILWHDKDNWTMYVSPYMVVNSDRFTKHYYAGSQRIASKIGAGEFNNLYDASKACITAGQKDYAERLNLITQSRNDYYAALGIPPGPPTAKGIYGEAEYSGVYGEYVIEPLGDYSVPTGWPMKPYKRPYGGTPGPPVMYEKPSDPEDEGAGYGYSNAEHIQEKDVFFYHSDHLGSTSYITDANGNATQFVCYKPYGEALVDEHNTSYEQPWKFNGKELDSETGLYYYGARYYEPTLAMWYGVDALAEKYPNMSPYNYCVGNPVKFVDPDGNKIKGFKIMNGNVTITKSASKDAIKIYNTMTKTTIGLKAFKSMILVPTKIKIVVEDSDTDYMGLTVGSNNVTKEGYYKRATVHINLNSINSVGSRFEYEEEGVIATGVHESIHTTDLEQINIDRNRDIDAEDNNRSLYWDNETKPMNAEYDARSEYREEKQLDNTKWKEIYESDKDSKGYSKPAFRGNNNQD